MRTAQVVRTVVIQQQEHVNVGPMMLVQEIRLTAMAEVAQVCIRD